jgi:hypothetical protein
MGTTTYVNTYGHTTRDHAYLAVRRYGLALDGCAGWQVSVAWAAQGMLSDRE